MLLKLPNNRVSFVDYLVEQIPNWDSLNSVTIAKNVYKNRLCSGFELNGTIYYRKETTTSKENRYPEASFELKQITYDMWEVLWIEYDGKRHYFINDYPSSSVHITTETT